MRGKGATEEENPWEEIPLPDDENHMQWASAGQLPCMSRMMRAQLNRYPVRTAMVLGVAGGNGPEHVDVHKLQRGYGVDINPAYLQACAARTPHLAGVLTCLCADLTDPAIRLPRCEWVIANLLIATIGYGCFQRVRAQVRPRYASCGIQIDAGEGFVSDAPYLHAFDGRDGVRCRLSEQGRNAAMGDRGYDRIDRQAYALPNGKQLWQLDFAHRRRRLSRCACPLWAACHMARPGGGARRAAQRAVSGGRRWGKICADAHPPIEKKGAM